MTLPEIVIEEPPRRWPVILLVTLLALSLAPLAFFSYVNAAFWGFSGQPVTVYAVALVAVPLAFIAVVVVLIALRRRRSWLIRWGWIAFGVYLVLLTIDAVHVLRLFVE